MAERKVESLLNAIENYDEKLSSERNTNKTNVKIDGKVVGLIRNY